MRLSIDGPNATFASLTLPLADFPGLLAGFLERLPQTNSIEAYAASMAQVDFPENQCTKFIQCVCKWGNYPGIAARVIRNNDCEAICEAFRNAHQAAGQGLAVDALAHVTRLHGLGVSFGSKHLKFLDPDHCVVLDRVISEQLGHPRTLQGYREFVAHCADVRDALEAAGVRRRDGGSFRIADVEMAIFAKLQDF